MKQVALRLVPVLALVLFAACEKKEETPATTATTEATAQQPAPTPAPTTMTATAIDLNTIPVAEEFEEEAEKELTATNLEQKLDAIEKEIEAE